MLTLYRKKMVKNERFVIIKLTYILQKDVGLCTSIKIILKHMEE